MHQKKDSFFNSFTNGAEKTSQEKGRKSTLTPPVSKWVNEGTEYFSQKKAQANGQSMFGKIFTSLGYQENAN